MKKTNDPFKIFLKILYAISLTIYLYFLIDGLSFYQISFQDRPHHEMYRNLRSAGFRGQGFGILGSAMMLLMMLYTVRKRTRFFGDWGPLSRWLNIHIYLGVMGPLFIILHTTLKLNGLVSISFWSMIAVATSGILGRYLYLQIPRNRRGKELSLKEIETVNQAFTHQLKTELKLDDTQFKRLQFLSGIKVDKNENTLSLLFHMVSFDIMKIVRNRHLEKLYRRELGLSGKLLKKAIDIINRKMLLQRRILLLNRVNRLFHYWHVFHKPFAILMFIIMFIHIGVAIWLGYTWIF